MNELKTETGAGDHASRLALRQLIRADQLTAARHTVMLSIPVAFVLSGISTFVAWHSGKFWVALIWLACATLVNLVRTRCAASRRNAWRNWCRGWPRAVRCATPATWWN